MNIPFDNSYARLPERFYARTTPVRVSAPQLIIWNDALAQQLCLDTARMEPTTLAEFFSGNRLPDGAEPLAQAYAGHQFGYFVPQLGDGRAVLLGEVLDQQGQRFDIQLKGAGRTPFSRSGDGRAPIGPVLREYLVSEAMHALGVPTTRALAAVSTGEAVFRDVSQPGAVITRVASSHLRIGTVQYFAARGDRAALTQLIDYTLARHFPAAAAIADSAQRPGMVLLEQVVARQARLVAQWMALGFIHGVMNTDNMTLSGETIDYGPCAFMEQFAPHTVFSAIDRDGRYAWDQQPRIAQWNLARLAEALLNAEEEPSAGVAEAERIVGGFMPQYAVAWRTQMGAKLGLLHVTDDDDTLIQQCLTHLEQQGADFTQCFTQLTDFLVEKRAAHSTENGRNEPVPTLLPEDWLAAWQARLAHDNSTVEQQVALMRQHNPIVIPRNHLVAEVITAAEEQQDYAPFKRLLAAVTRPYQAPTEERLRQPAPAEERVWRTFCGT